MLQGQPATTVTNNNNLINMDKQTTVTSSHLTTIATNKRLGQEKEHKQADSQENIERFTFFWSASSPFSQHYLANF